MKRSEELWSEDQFMDTSPGGFAELSPGDTIGKFRIIRELGKGGMGAVYLAVNPTLQIEVALKILPPAVVRDTPQVAGRFIREARLAASISHPNVVAVKDADKDPATGLYYIVMEYVSGGSLGDRLANGPLSEDEALRVVYDMAQALAVAEEHGIVHRDIKPDNIMLDSRGIAKLADLGVAKQAMAKATNLTQEGSSIGTPAYMSPDQIRNAQDADTRDDIYSLGATLYELLTGQPPFDGSTAYNIVSKVLSSPTPNARDLNPDISPSVSGLCLKMMARSKLARHQSATALINDLERLSELGWGPDASDPHQKETLGGEVLIPPSLEQMARRHANRYAESEYDDDRDGSAGTSRTFTWVLSGMLACVLAVGAFLMFRPTPQPAEPGVKKPTQVTTKPPAETNTISIVRNSERDPEANPVATKDPEIVKPPGPKPKSGPNGKSTTGKPAPEIPPAPKSLLGNKDPILPPYHPELGTLPPGVVPAVDPSEVTIKGPQYDPPSGLKGSPALPVNPEIPMPVPPAATNLAIYEPPRVDRDPEPEPPHSRPTTDPGNQTQITVPVEPPPSEPVKVPELEDVIAGMPAVAPVDSEEISVSGLGQPMRHVPKPQKLITAFEARDLAKLQIQSLAARTKLLKITGDRPKDGSPTPTHWHILFWNPDATHQFQQVDVINGVAGKAADGTIFIPRLTSFKESEVIRADQLKVDSDAALRKIKNDPRLKGFNITSAQFYLDNARDPSPAWRVIFYGNFPGKPRSPSRLGEAYVTVETNSIKLTLDKD